MQINPCPFRLINKLWLWPGMFPCTYPKRRLVLLAPSTFHFVRLLVDPNSSPQEHIINGKGACGRENIWAWLNSWFRWCPCTWLHPILNMSAYSTSTPCFSMSIKIDSINHVIQASYFGLWVFYFITSRLARPVAVFAWKPPLHQVSFPYNSSSQAIISSECPRFSRSHASCSCSVFALWHLSHYTALWLTLCFCFSL